jgi:hypothetical protein
MNRPLQDVFKVHCFGCGALNAHGLQIKSRWDGDDMRNYARAVSPGHPVCYGGTIARWSIATHLTALAHYCRETVYPLDDGPPPFAL